LFKATFTIVVSTISSKAHKTAVIVIITLLKPYSTNSSSTGFTVKVYYFIFFKINEFYFK